jgi:hypothetical protein
VTFKSLANSGAWEEIIRLKVTPVGDLNKVITRQVNVKQLARQQSLIKFIKTRQAYVNGLIIEHTNNIGT